LNVTVHTNVLIRAVVRDDPTQTIAAVELLRTAEKIAIPISCLCEFVWVLRKFYRFSIEDIAAAVRALKATANVEMNRAAVEAGLAILEQGGDFADGVIAHEGEWLGGEIFVSFDKTAVSSLTKLGHKTRLLS
jgi:predicted nucleic-acid-binding protein